MKLYFSKGACSLVVRIIINELGLKSDYEAVNLKTKETESGKNFLTINSKGSVPVIEIKPNEVLTENVVILQYLADSNKATNLLPAVDDFKRYRTLEVLNFITTEIHKTFSTLFNPKMPKEVNQDIIIPILKTKFAHVNQMLGNKKFLMGDHFTLPDAYIFVTLSWAERMKIDLSDNKQLLEYYARLKKHPSVIESLKEEELVLS